MTENANEKEMVGILAYGSLTSDPGCEIYLNHTRKISDVETPFGVEFARRSEKRGYAPTLVPFETGRRVNGQIFVMAVNEREAADMLYRRECNKVGILSCKYSKKICPIICEEINWEDVRRKHHIDTIYVKKVIHNNDEWPTNLLATWIGANMGFTDIENKKACYAERLAYNAIISISDTEIHRDGITYLINAIGNGINTFLSEAYKDSILELTKSDDLCQAFLKSDKLKEELKELLTSCKDAEESDLGEEVRSERIGNLKEKLKLVFRSM